LVQISVDLVRAAESCEMPEYPLPPGQLESEVYARESTKIFGFKELIDKIFRTKDLASANFVLRRYAQRVIYN
jgi:hypothetical protein